MTPEKRETAIKWLQEEIRSLRLAPQINGCGPENWADLLDIMETCLEAVRDYHFPDTRKMVPLTLEQLRGMGGEPVYLKNFNTKFNNGWHILKGITKDEIKFRFEGYMEAVVKTELLGVEFNLYSYPPAHIDREVWMAEWRNHYRSGATAGTGYVCSSCDVWNGRKSHICPSCGKAMDADGLSEREKRLRG